LSTLTVYLDDEHVLRFNDMDKDEACCMAQDVAATGLEWASDGVMFFYPLHRIKVVTVTGAGVKDTAGERAA
jgi:hypothetical protein